VSNVPKVAVISTTDLKNVPNIITELSQKGFKVSHDNDTLIVSKAGYDLTSELLPPGCTAKHIVHRIPTKDGGVCPVLAHAWVIKEIHE